MLGQLHSIGALEMSEQLSRSFTKAFSAVQVKGTTGPVVTESETLPQLCKLYTLTGRQGLLRVSQRRREVAALLQCSEVRGHQRCATSVGSVKDPVDAKAGLVASRSALPGHAAVDAIASLACRSALNMESLGTSARQPWAAFDLAQPAELLRDRGIGRMGAGSGNTN